MSEKPANQVVLDELQETARTPEDLAALREWQEEQDSARAKVMSDLGGAPQEYAMMPDGSVVPKTEAQSVQQGEESSHPYGNGGRRA